MLLRIGILIWNTPVCAQNKRDFFDLFKERRGNLRLKVIIAMGMNEITVDALKRSQE